jgi:hypothetical protein
MSALVRSPDWEENVNGMTGVYRLLHHHTDFMLTEHKQILQHLMVQVKNLRSQVKNKTLS